MRRLDCVIQKYAWGTRGEKSRVAQLKLSENSDFQVRKFPTAHQLSACTHKYMIRGFKTMLAYDCTNRVKMLLAKTLRLLVPRAVRLLLMMLKMV